MTAEARSDGKRHHVYFGCAFAEQHGEQFLIAQRSGAFAQEFLAWPVGFGDVVDGLAHGSNSDGQMGLDDGHGHSFVLLHFHPHNIRELLGGW